MFQKIETILKNQGYQKVSLNVPGLYFHLFPQETTSYAVVSIDETTGTLLTKEQFIHISEQIREYLAGHDFRINHFLYLLLTEQPSSAERLFSEHDCYWVIQPASGQFRVYENWNAFYSPLRTALEQLFFSPAGSMETAPEKQGASGSFSVKHSLLSCTFILVIMNVAIFLLTDFAELFFQSDRLIEQGAISWQDVIFNRQYYRILTSMFLHLGLDHIFNNMLVLYFIGSYLEQIVGKRCFTAIYFFSGILAGCTSIVYNMIQHTVVISVGASGAIFGLMGALLTVVLLKRNRGTEMDARRLLFSIFISLYGGFTSQGVDNAAHIGGFIGGILITAILCLTERRDTKTCYE